MKDKRFNFKMLSLKLMMPIMMPKAVKKIFATVQIGKLISVCPGKRHAWYESNVGPVRKPIL